MNIKLEKCDIRTWKNIPVFLDTSSANVDTPVLSLYQCVETRNVEVFKLLFQRLPLLRFNLFVISEAFATKVLFRGPNRWKSHFPP
jgi:hypothetical protein